MPSARIFSITAKPSRSGSMTSSTMASKCSLLARATASRPVPTPVACHPRTWQAMTRSSERFASSSTMSMRADEVSVPFADGIMNRLSPHPA